MTQSSERTEASYYTPVEVVQAQVRLAGELLSTRFGKQLAYAEEEVVVLDPAVGTGTYPLAVLDHASETVRNRLGPGAVAEKLHSLAARLYAFEILVGPYSVAHLRLSQSLKDAGVLAVTPKVYLTDTLESPNQLPEFTASLLQAQLTEERTRAQAVKKDTRVFVCLGNPPYDREERDPLDDTGPRKGGWVRHGEEGADATQAILEDFRRPAIEAGHSIHLKNLYNDYVYFWRWALWKVFDSTEDAGIVTFITASSYLRGPGFTGMRRKMRQVFDELWIIDLEGDSIGARKTENVFAIRTAGCHRHRSSQRPSTTGCSCPSLENKVDGLSAGEIGKVRRRWSPFGPRMAGLFVRMGCAFLHRGGWCVF